MSNFTDPDFEGEDPRQAYLEFHGSPLIASWLPLINAAVIIAALRWSKLSFFAHLVIALIVIGLSLGACIPLLKFEWLEEEDKLVEMHKYAGFIMLIWLGVEFLSGLFARFIQFPQAVHPWVSFLTKRVHIFFSYLIMILAKFNYYNIQFLDDEFNPKFILLIIIDCICLGIYLWIKFGYWTLSEETVDNQLAKPLPNPERNFISNFFHSVADCFLNVWAEITQKQMKLPIRRNIGAEIKSESEITQQEYVIFNDHVYDTSEMKWFHPGGEKLIRLVNKREVDRFLYGCYAHELYPNTKIWSHTQDSLRIAGPPVAKIIRSSPMKGLEELSKFKVSSCSPISPSGKTFLVNLVPTPQNSVHLKFTGFENESQLGQYFVLTVASKTGRSRCTRLYTTIWCMRRENLRFYQKNFPHFNTLSNFSSLKKEESEMVLTERENINKDFQESVPLVIKRYENGELTPRFLSTRGQQFDGEVVLSQPMGAGMKFDQLPDSGSVVIVCGGTGILPFCDLIDILFKRVKFLDSSALSDALTKSDSLVGKDLIKQRNFVIYCAVEDPRELPSLTFYQLNELSGSSKIKLTTVMRVSREAEIVQRDFKNIKLQREYFDKQVQAHTNEGNLAQIYICGPPNMNASIGELMVRRQVDTKKYHFM